MASAQAGMGMARVCRVVFTVTLGMRRVSLDAMRFSWLGMTRGITLVWPVGLRSGFCR